MQQFKTLVEAIEKVGEHHPDIGFVFQNMKGEESEYTFREITKVTAHRAAALQQLGLKKGDTAGLVILEPEDFVLTFFAMLRLGVVPVPLYPPVSLGNLDAYFDRTTRVLTDAQAKVLVVSSKLQNILFSLLDRIPTLQNLLRAEELHGAAGTPNLPTILPEDLAFLQYTSGSTSDPKGVMVTHGCLAANSKAIVGEHLGVRPEKGDKGVSWLPLYHDMGLIGFVIATYFYGVPVVFIPTLRFLRRPTCWLETMHKHRGTISFAPNFAYALATKKAKPADMANWDLSCVKTLGCGAEPINANTMREFTKRFNEHCELPETAILPAYGMAEATLAISLKPAQEEMVTTTVHAESFQAEGRVVEPVEGEPSIEHVSCGIPFLNHEVAAFSDSDERLTRRSRRRALCEWSERNTGVFQQPRGYRIHL